MKRYRFVEVHSDSLSTPYSDVREDPEGPYVEYAEVAALLAKVLWAVHVQGPDSIIAMPDLETAEKRAGEWNAMFADMMAKLPESRRRFAPTMHAEVIPYTGGVRGHAKQIAEHGGNPEDIC